MSNFSLSIRIWYRQNGRILPWRETNDPYLIWLSEIILQQTRVEQGLPYFQQFVKHFPDVHSLAKADENDVLNLWQGLGYYSRARNLHKTAQYISEDLKGNFPSTHEEIIKLKGIGPYTAAAISSFAFNEMKAVVDGNVYRVLSRVFDIETAINSSSGKKEFQNLADSLICGEDPGTHNQALMELGAMVCKPVNPNCQECPLSSICLSLVNNTIKDRPVKEKKIKVRDRYFHYLIFENNNKTFLEQRLKKDIWEKLFQFPMIESDYGIVKDLPAGYTRQSKEIRHILSHQRIHATFYHYSDFPEKIPEQWVMINKEAIDDYPLPRLIDKYLESLSTES